MSLKQSWGLHGCGQLILGAEFSHLFDGLILFLVVLLSQLAEKFRFLLQILLSFWSRMITLIGTN